MFFNSDFNQDISKWNVSNVGNISRMFEDSKFNKDISNWKIRPDCATYNTFFGCKIKEKYKPKSLQN